MNSKKVIISSFIISAYVVIMYLSQGFAFGQYQIRIATSLYSLSYLFTFLIIPMGLCNLLSNMIMGGLGILDILGGTITGIITSYIIGKIKTLNWSEWFVVIPIILVPGILVPIWLSVLLKTPYLVLVFCICIGQTIPAILGVFLIKALKVIRINYQ